MFEINQKSFSFSLIMLKNQEVNLQKHLGSKQFALFTIVLLLWATNNKVECCTNSKCYKVEKEYFMLLAAKFIMFFCYLLKLFIYDAIKVKSYLKFWYPLLEWHWNLKHINSRWLMTFKLKIILSIWRKYSNQKLKIYLNINF